MTEDRFGSLRDIGIESTERERDHSGKVYRLQNLTLHLGRREGRGGEAREEWSEKHEDNYERVVTKAMGTIISIKEH